MYITCYQCTNESPWYLKSCSMVSHSICHLQHPQPTVHFMTKIHLMSRGLLESSGIAARLKPIVKLHVPKVDLTEYWTCHSWSCKHPESGTKGEVDLLPLVWHLPKDASKWQAPIWWHQNWKHHICLWLAHCAKVQVLSTQVYQLQLGCRLQSP